MRKNICALFCVVAILLFFSNVSIAQDLENRFSIGTRLSYVDVADDKVEDITIDPDNTILLEGNLTYYFSNSFSLEFLIGYTETDVDAKIIGTGVNFGELEQIPLLLTGHYHFWINPESNIYLGGGIGYYLNDFSLSGLVKSIDPNLDIDADDSFGYHVNAGFETFITDNMTLNLDLKYIWNKADFTARETGFPDETDEVDLNAFVIGLGIKYYF
jgi:outer membrane protein